MARPTSDDLDARVVLLRQSVAALDKAFGRSLAVAGLLMAGNLAIAVYAIATGQWFLALAAGVWVFQSILMWRQGATARAMLPTILQATDLSEKWRLLYEAEVAGTSDAAEHSSHTS